MSVLWKQSESIKKGKFSSKVSCFLCDFQLKRISCILGSYDACKKLKTSLFSSTIAKIPTSVTNFFVKKTRKAFDLTRNTNANFPDYGNISTSDTLTTLSPETSSKVSSILMLRIFHSN